MTCSIFISFGYVFSPSFLVEEKKIMQERLLMHKQVVLVNGNITSLSSSTFIYTYILQLEYLLLQVYFCCLIKQNYSLVHLIMTSRCRGW